MTPLLPIHFDDEVANPCSAAQVLYPPSPAPHTAAAAVRHFPREEEDAAALLVLLPFVPAGERSDLSHLSLVLSPLSPPLPSSPRLTADISAALDVLLFLTKSGRVGRV